MTADAKLSLADFDRLADQVAAMPRHDYDDCPCHAPMVSPAVAEIARAAGLTVISSAPDTGPAASSLPDGGYWIET